MAEKLQRQTSLKSQIFRETSCAICGTTFGVVDCTYIKKYGCKMCFKAICINCSGLPAETSVSKTFDLICKICVSKSGSSSNEENKEISEIYHQCVDLMQKQAKIREKIEKNKHKTKQYQRMMNEREGQDADLSLLSKKEELVQKYTSLKSTVDSLCQQIEDQETIYFESETFLLEEKIRLDNSKKQSLELYKTLAIKQDENIQLSKQLDSLDLRTRGKKKTDVQISRERNLKKAYEKLLETEKFFTDRNIQLCEELKTLERDMNEKDEELVKIQQEILGVEAEEDFLKQLNETLQEQQELIRKLKSEMEDRKAGPIEAKNRACSLM